LSPRERCAHTHCAEAAILTIALPHSLKRQLMVSTLLMTPVLYGLSYGFLPSTRFVVSGVSNVAYWHIFICIAVGLWAGLIIGYITEYYTSNAYKCAAPPSFEVPSAVANALAGPSRR
jgi:Na+/H+-translocating membrane pyrophosphatase